MPAATTVPYNASSHFPSQPDGPLILTKEQPGPEAKRLVRLSSSLTLLPSFLLSQMFQRSDQTY
jgi:hypothetical protein